MKTALKLFAVAIMMCGATIAQAEIVERVAEADPKGTVDISNIAGEVRVTGWDRAEVAVKADIDDNIERLEFERRGAVTIVKAVYRSGRGGGKGAMLDIHAPRDSAIKTTTVSADQIVRDMRGAQRLQSVSGDIRTQTSADDLYVSSVSGDVDVTGAGDKTPANARTRIATVSGEIKAMNLGGEVEVESVSGSIDASAGDVARARIKTTSGEATLRASLRRDARIEAESINGELTIELLGKIDAEFDIESFNGSIDNCFGPKSQRVSEFGPGRELRFKEGDGSARVRIKTLNGAINLCRK